MSAGACYRCGGALSENAFGRGDACPACGADARCCRNCVFEEPSYRPECRETQAEPVHDRESANYCDYFRPGRKPAGTRSPMNRAPEAFAALFSKRPPRG